MLRVTLLFLSAGALLGLSFLLQAPWASLAAAVLGTLLFSRVAYRLEQTKLIHAGLFGATIYAIGCYWVLPVVRAYFDVSLVTAILIVATWLFYQSLQFVLLLYLAKRLHRYRVPRALCIPLAWLSAEELFPGVFPWSLSYSFFAMQPLLQSVDILGASGLTAMILWWGCVSANRSKLITRTGALLSFVILFFYGELQIDRYDHIIRNSEPLRVSLVQPDFEPKRDFVAEKVRSNIQQLQTLSAPAVSQSDLLIWPESSVLFDIADDTTRIADPQHPYAGVSTTLLFGGQSKSTTQQGALPAYYNSAIAISGDQVQSYFKQQLFPLTEAIPLQEVLVASGVIPNRGYRLLSGKDQQPLRLQTEAGVPYQAVLGICYEDLHPNVFRQGTKRTTDPSILVALTNDAWFLDSIAAWQHNHLARSRAIENRRFLVRASVDGVTAVISPTGEIVDSIASGTAGLLQSGKVRLLEGRTPYQRVIAQLLQVLSWIVLISAVGRTIVKRLTRSRSATSHSTTNHSRETK